MVHAEVQRDAVVRLLYLHQLVHMIPDHARHHRRRHVIVRNGHVSDHTLSRDLSVCLAFLLLSSDSAEMERLAGGPQLASEPAGAYYSMNIVNTSV